MNATFPLLIAAALWLSLVGCGVSDDLGTSPFQGDGRIGIRGVVVAMRVDAELMRAAVPEGPPARLPSGVRADLFVLDEDVCGGPVAAVFRGADPAVLTDALVELGWLIPEEGARERFGLGSVLDPMSTIHAMGGLPGRMARARARLDPRARPSVKRVVRDADLMLTPTVDLRDDLWHLSDAMDRDLAQDTGLAVAVDGPQSARLVQREIVPAFRAAGALFDLVQTSNKGQGLVDEISAASIVRALAAVLDALEGAIFRPEGDAYRMTFDFEDGGETPVEAIFKASRGAWPAVLAGGTQVSLTLDLARSAALFAVLSSEDESKSMAKGDATHEANDAFAFEPSSFPLDGRVFVFSDPSEDEADRGTVAFGLRPECSDTAVLEWQKTSEHGVATWIRRLGGGENGTAQVSEGWLWCGQVLQLGAPITGDSFLRFRALGFSGSARAPGGGRILAELRPDP